MWIFRLLLYTIVALIASCTTATPTPLLPSIAPTATLDLSFPLQLTLYGTGDYATPPFEAIEATTSDGEFVTLDITLHFSVSLLSIRNVDIHNWDNYQKNEVIPEIRETMKEVIGQYTAREIYGENRLDVNDHLQMKLTSNLSDYGINVQDVLVRDVAFTAEFNDKVEQEIIATMTTEAQLSTVTP
jgi:regulator of protease activity HflC (stomatin/prohibitin superfamily)